MWVFLVVVAMLFLGAIIGYLVVRVNPNLEAPFIPEGATGLPGALVFSTMALMVSSYSMRQATRHVRQGRSQEAHRSMTITLVLACAFLALQIFAWVTLWRQNIHFGDSLYAWSFYILTGLHALHVLAGFFPLIPVWRKTARRGYGKDHPEGILYFAKNLHLLGGIWLLGYLSLGVGLGT